MTESYNKELKESNKKEYCVIERKEDTVGGTKELKYLVVSGDVQNIKMEDVGVEYPDIERLYGFFLEFIYDSNTDLSYLEGLYSTVDDHGNKREDNVDHLLNDIVGEFEGFGYERNDSIKTRLDNNKNKHN